MITNVIEALRVVQAGVGTMNDWVDANMSCEEEDENGDVIHEDGCDCNALVAIARWQKGCNLYHMGMNALFTMFDDETQSAALKDFFKDVEQGRWVRPKEAWFLHHFPDGTTEEQIDQYISSWWDGLDGNDIAEMVEMNYEVTFTGFDTGYLAGLVGEFWGSEDGVLLKNGAQVRLDRVLMPFLTAGEAPRFEFESDEEIRAFMEDGQYDQVKKAIIDTWPKEESGVGSLA